MLTRAGLEKISQSNGPTHPHNGSRLRMGNGSEMFSGIPTAAGKFVLIGGEQRYPFELGTPWIDLVKGVLPRVPVANGLVGARFNAAYVPVRKDNGQ